MATQTYYITTPIYYVNDMPHIGHIYTTVMADALARYHRLLGHDVRFLTGTDEHGQKIEKSAAAKGIQPIELADSVVSRYHQLWELLNISNDDFIRTTEDRHKAAVGEMIHRIVAAGDIFKADYEGWYCAGAEAFVPDSQVEDGIDTETGYPVERLSEPSWFFRLSAYQDRLLEWYRNNPDCIKPKSRYNEVVRFVEGGLKDLSISRTSISWGVPYPDDPDHVVYVWLDALTNYVSALGFGSSDESLYEQFWPASLHLVGKDILRFHCVYWPAFLMSAGLPLPETVFGHGWWLRDDAKMSKSLGNVVRPDYLVERFGTDALRYFLAREMTFGQDASFSDQAFLERFNADLANALGNTASRTVSMTHRFLDGVVPPATGAGAVAGAADEAVTAYRRHMDALEPNRALEAVWRLLATINGHIQERQPWALAKQGDDGRADLEATLYDSLEGLRITAALIAPFMPDTAALLDRQLGIESSGAVLDERVVWGGLQAGGPIGEAQPLFPRVDIKKAMKELAMRNEEGTPVPDQAPADTAPTGEPAPSEDGLIAIDDFAKVKLVVGQVKEAERVPKSKKLIRLQVDLGEPELRQIVAGIGKAYEPDDLVGRRIVVVANLEPAKLMGVESRGMLLAASIDGEPALLHPDGDVAPGTGVR
jgi:methionyl-tRNA synthetase